MNSPQHAAERIRDVPSGCPCHFEWDAMFCRWALRWPVLGCPWHQGGK